MNELEIFREADRRARRRWGHHGADALHDALGEAFVRHLEAARRSGLRDEMVHFIVLDVGNVLRRTWKRGAASSADVARRLGQRMLQPDEYLDTLGTGDGGMDALLDAPQPPLERGVLLDQARRRGVLDTLLEQGWQRKAIAVAIGVSGSMVTRWLSGERSLSDSSYMALCALLKSTEAPPRCGR